MLLHLLVAAALSASPPSDPVGVYAIVDRVVLEGDAARPTAIIVYGTFAVSDQKGGDHYLGPTKGYMYFKVGSNESATRAEWNDLKAVAGKKELVGFAVKWMRNSPGRVRCATETPKDPDEYTINVGLTRIAAERNSGWDIAKGLVSGNAPAAPCAGKK